LLGLALGVSPFDDNGLTLDVTKISKPLPERIPARSLRIRSEIADPRNFLQRLRLSYHCNSKLYGDDQD